jgi:hypothetical protein
MFNHFPTTVIDGFFDDPDYIRDLALRQSYSPDPQGNWPGERTQELEGVLPSIHRSFCLKFLSLWYDLERESLSWDISTYFQRIPKLRSGGWIHKDMTLGAGVIYLNPQSKSSAGTTLFRAKPEYDSESIPTPEIKNSYYKGETVDAKEYDRVRAAHEAKFTTSLEVSNEYNRLVSYGLSPHRESSFDVGDEDRLTMVFFVRDLSTLKTPLMKLLRGV